MASALEPAGDILVGGFASVLQYWWVIIPFVVIVAGGLIVWFIKSLKKKSSQWTHTLRIRRVMPNGMLTDPIYHKMRRFPLIKKAEVFELEIAVLGGYLMPELDVYSGENEFSIILDTNNRIYTNNGEKFCPDEGYVMVSAKHSEIDIQRSNLKADFQNINKTSKRIEWATIAKYAFMIMGIIAAMILGIVGIQNWSEAQSAKATQATAEAAAMASLAEGMDVMAATVNTQKLEIIPMLQELYGTRNIQSIINRPVYNGTV